MNKKIKYSFILLVMFLSFSILFLGCGAKKSSSVSDSAAPSASGKPEFAAGEGTSNNVKDKAGDKAVSPDKSKVIKTAEVNLDTKNYENTIETILTKVKEKNGYIESSKSYGSGEDNSRGSYYVIRMPKNYFDDFLLNVGNLGKVTSSSTSGENISSQYYDTQAHLKALKVQEERLLDLLKKSGSLKDILDIENQLSNVRYQIESLTSTMKNWDNQVDYATINININEVKEITSKPVTLWDKINKTFSDSLKSLGKLFNTIILVIVAVIPYLIIIIPASIIVFITVKKKKKKE